MLYEHEAEKYPKFKNKLRTPARPRKGEELLFWILHKIMEINCFSANDRQYNIGNRIVCIALFVNHFYLSLYCFLASQGSGYLVKHICASGCFVRMENNKCRILKTNNYI